MTKNVLNTYSEGAMSKERLNLTVESEAKKKAFELADQTRLSVSEIFELLVQGISADKILKEFAKGKK